MNHSTKKLARQLNSRDVNLRAEAAEGLCHRGNRSRQAAVELVKAMADDSEEVLEWASAALEQMGPPTSDNVQQLTELLQNPSPDVAYWAATLLGRLEGDAQAAVEPLTTALTSHPALNVRERAAWALGKIGPASRPAVPALREAAGSGRQRLARLANRALEQIAAGAAPR